MAAVALLLLGCQDDRGHQLETGCPSSPESARHRGDVGIAHLREGLSREQRADAAGAVQDHRCVTVGRDALDLLLDIRLRHVLGAGQVALLPFRVFTDIDDGGGAHGEGVDFLWGDFSDLRAGLAEEVGVGLRHGVGGSDDRRAGSGFRARAGEGGSRFGVRGDEPASGRPQTPAAALDPACHAPASAGLGVVFLGSLAPRSPRTCWRLSWLSIAHLRRAGLISMPSRSSRSSAPEGRDVLDRLALDLVGQEAGTGLADRAAAAREGDASTTPSWTPSISVIRSPHSGLAPS